MITRAMLSLGLVWLLMPHHPDLGLPAAPEAVCAADPACGASQQERDAIFQRLRAVRSEIQTEKQARVGMLSGVMYGQGKSRQKADFPPSSRHGSRRMASNAQGDVR